MTELTITTPLSIPESTPAHLPWATLCQSRLYPPSQGLRIRASVLVLGVPTIRKFIVRPFFSLSEIMKHLLGQEGEEEEEEEVAPAQIPRKTNQTDGLHI
jgi:hypothetical protein